MAKISRHIEQYMNKTQKIIGYNTRGAKHQLLVDRAVALDTKTKSANLCTALIDYKKAYNSMPHTEAEPHGQIMKRVAIDIDSKMRKPSVTSSTWMTSSYTPRKSVTWTF